MASIIFFILGTLFFCILLLNILSLPANWILVFMFAILYIIPGFTISFTTLLCLIAIAVIAEVLEAGVQMSIAKKSGASLSGNWAGIFGSIIGAILGMPFLLGLGALIGALIGAWLGCYIVERMRGKNDRHATRAAFGSLQGRLLGFTIKMALGAYIIVYGIQHTTFITEYPEYNIPVLEGHALNV